MKSPNAFRQPAIALIASALALSACSLCAIGQTTAGPAVAAPAARAVAPNSPSDAATDAAPPAPTSPVPPEAAAAQAPIPPGETITAPGSTAPRTWTTDQILTATVHQAWILAGKDESNFFAIVRELAEISAQNRDLTLPDSPEAGKKAGAYIRAQAKEDHDQLLYEIVDKAVRMTGTKSTAAAASAAPARPPEHPAN